MKTMIVSLSAEEFAALEELSEYEGESIEGAIRLAIRQYKYDLQTFYGANNDLKDSRQLSFPFGSHSRLQSEDEFPF